MEVLKIKIIFFSVWVCVLPEWHLPILDYFLPWNITWFLVQVNAKLMYDTLEMVLSRAQLQNCSAHSPFTSQTCKNLKKGAKTQQKEKNKQQKGLKKANKL